VEASATARLLLERIRDLPMDGDDRERLSRWVEAVAADLG